MCCVQALASGPGALFVAPDGANTTSDLAVKVREDPLFVIRKKEEDAKKLLMSNPIKMKQLQQVVLVTTYMGINTLMIELMA